MNNSFLLFPSLQVCPVCLSVFIQRHDLHPDQLWRNHIHRQFFFQLPPYLRRLRLAHIEACDPVLLLLKYTAASLYFLHGVHGALALLQFEPVSHVLDLKILSP